MTLYYNQHLGMNMVLMHSWGRSEEPAKVPPRKQAKKREKFLNERKLFDCPNCRRIVRWDFGADVGHPEYEQYRDFEPVKGPQLPLSLELSEHAQMVIALDRYLRLCCDECWGDIVTRKNLPRKGWDR